MKTELTPKEKSQLIELGGEIINAKMKGYTVNEDKYIIYYELLNEYNRLKQTFGSVLTPPLYKG